MVNLLHQFFCMVWHVEIVPSQYIERGMYSEKGDKEVPGYYRVLSRKKVNKWLVGVLYEGKAGFRL